MKILLIGKEEYLIRKKNKELWDNAPAEERCHMKYDDAFFDSLTQGSLFGAMCIFVESDKVPLKRELAQMNDSIHDIVLTVNGNLKKEDRKKLSEVFEIYEYKELSAQDFLRYVQPQLNLFPENIRSIVAKKIVLFYEETDLASAIMKLRQLATYPNLNEDIVGEILPDKTEKIFALVSYLVKKDAKSLFRLSEQLLLENTDVFPMIGVLERVLRIAIKLSFADIGELGISFFAASDSRQIADKALVMMHICEQAKKDIVNGSCSDVVRWNILLAELLEV